MEKELRFIRSNITLSERIVSGYAIRFMEESVDLGGFIERIHPEAISIDQIRNSDIFAFFNHDNDKVLGRTGAGTLKLDLREDGLYYEIDVPDTVAGNELLEHIKRGEMYGTSFAFSLPSDDSGDVWSRDEQGNIYRDITNIEFLYEISPVFSPAYPTTTVSARSLEKIQELQDMIKEDIELREEEVKDPEEEKQDEEPKEEEKSENCDEKEEEREDPKEDEVDESESETEDEEDKEEKEDEKDPEEERNIKTQNKESKTMEARFSLLRAINEIANGQKLDAASQAVVNAGAEEMRKAGQPFSGQIQLPVGEFRADPDPVHYTVEADGEHVVVTDYLNILEPLKSKNVLVAAGANYLTGLQGNLQIPSMSAENVFWEGEITEAQNGAGSFDHINMAPRRLSAYIDISKQFLIQDTLGAEALIRKLLVEAINDKLEATILSDDNASGNVPAGIFNGVTPTAITDFASVCDFESELDQNNFVGDFKYVINPKAKSYLRSTIKGTNATGMIMENDAIDGTPCETTTHMAEGTLAYGDWSNLYIAQFGGLDLVVDNYTQATKGCVRLVINALFDYKVVREGAIVLGEIKRD